MTDLYILNNIQINKNSLKFIKCKKNILIMFIIIIIIKNINIKYYKKYIKYNY